MDEEIVDIDTSTDDGDQTGELDLFDDGDDTETEQSNEQLKKTNKQLYARLKKAEGFELKDGKWVKPEPKPEIKPEAKKEDGLSPTDFYALIKADAHEDDISEVTDFAKWKGISIPEALKNPLVKARLAERREERETANNTATGNTRRGPAKPNASQILERARNKGELPETDEEMAMLVKAQFESK